MGGALTGDKANSVVFDNAKIKRAYPALWPPPASTRAPRAVRYVESHPECQASDPESTSGATGYRAVGRAVEGLPVF
jgi:hypothetical protein